MKLMKVNSLPAFYYTCLLCKRRFSSMPGYTDSSQCYADLDGEPYNAYYCTHCKDIIKKENKKQDDFGCDVELGDEGNINICEWNIVNAEDEIIGKIYTSTNSRKVAFEKLKFKMPSTYHFVKLVKVQNMKRKNKNLGCDVELGSVGDTMKYGTILIVSGGLAYAMWKFNLFGGLKWLKDAFRDLKLAPKTIAVFEDEQLNVRGSQIEKMFNVLKQKADNFTTQYGKLYDEWLTLKNQIKTGVESYSKTFYESGKMQYFGSKSSKEKMIERLDSFRTKVLTELRVLQTKKNFKLNAKWEIVGCLPCIL